MKPTELTCDIYEQTLNCKKDLHLSIKLDEFDPSRLALVKDDLNHENYNIFYDGKKFRLFVKKLYAKVKKSRVLENDYLSIKDDQTNTKKKLYDVFSSIKSLVNSKLKEDEMCSFIDWNRIWLNCIEYDMTNKHWYHFENLYIALDSVIALYDPFLKSYKLDCEMIDACVYLCENAIRFCYSLSFSVTVLQFFVSFSCKIMDNLETYKIRDLFKLYIMLGNVKEDSTPSIIVRRQNVRQLIVKKFGLAITDVPLIAQYEQLIDYLLYGCLKNVDNSLTTITLRIERLQGEIFNSLTTVTNKMEQLQEEIRKK